MSDAKKGEAPKTSPTSTDLPSGLDGPRPVKAKTDSLQSAHPTRNATVLGAGSWGTALALLLARNGHFVKLVGRPGTNFDDLADSRQNKRYLPRFVLPSNVEIAPLKVEHDPADFLVVALPCDAIESHMDVIGRYSSVLLASKGLLPGPFPILSDALAAQMPTAAIAAISGPNLAVELAQGIPSAGVVACRDTELADLIRRSFSSSRFRVYRTNDIRGVELAGALKNVYAIGAGISDGLGFGDNTKAAYLARALNEMSRLGVMMGCELETFLGLAGVGDLIATANSRLSRNYRVGFGLATGDSLEDVLDKIGQVAEGVQTAKRAMAIAVGLNCKAMLLRGIVKVMDGEATPTEALAELMERDTPTENG